MAISKDANGWLMVLVVLVAAGVTSWVMLRNQTVQNPYAYPPQRVAQYLSPGITALKQEGILIAGTKGIPVIRAGAVPVHSDRGVCASCHTVVSSRGERIPTITAASKMKHDYRGVCSNCHKLVVQHAANTNIGNIQAAIQVAAAGQGAFVPGGANPVPAVLEGEWMGLEVAPITPISAKRYGIPYGARGVMVAEAEAAALTAGLKAGDVVQTVNGMPVSNIAEFVKATQNGRLSRGIVEILRKGHRLAAQIAPAINQVIAAMPNTPVNVGNPAGWGGQQVAGNTQGWNPATANTQAAFQGNAIPNGVTPPQQQLF